MASHRPLDDPPSAPRLVALRAPKEAPLASMQRHAQALHRGLPEPPLEGNQVDLLLDGGAAYAAMFTAIDDARDHINIESYIVEAEGPGEALAQRLLAKRREGVKVNLLFDHFGSLHTASDYFDALRDAGVHMCCYQPLTRRWGARLDHALHCRDHRKLLIVDGRVAFTGGVNISSVYALDAGHTSRPRMPWRDTHVRIQGPVVAALQQLFIAHWQRQSGQRPYLAHYFPRLAAQGSQRVGVAASEAGRRGLGGNPFYRSLLAAIDAAEHSVHLTAAYFVPPRRLLRALCQAAQRGVSVQLVVPGISDSWAALQAGRSHYSRLMKHGVRIHERQDALLHAKSAVIDGVWASVGSSNLDWRSMLHNAEANVVVLDPVFGAQLDKVFEHDVAHSEELSLGQWRRRGRAQRMVEAFTRRFEMFL